MLRLHQPLTRIAFPIHNRLSTQLPLATQVRFLFKKSTQKPSSPVSSSSSTAIAKPITSSNTSPTTSSDDLSLVDETKVNNHPILRKLPKFLRKYCVRFIDAPFSHVTSFLILHELTAIVPLIAIWWGLHKYNITIPLDMPLWAIDKGTKIIDKSLQDWDFTNFSLNDKVRLIMEGAYAYVIVKFLAPVRVLFSLWLMPWFSRVFVEPFTRIFKKKKLPQKQPLPGNDQPKLKQVEKRRL